MIKKRGKAIILIEATDPNAAAPDDRDAQAAQERAKLSLLIASIFAGLLFWDRVRLRYRTKEGYIAQKTLEAELNRIFAQAQIDLRLATQRLVDQQVTIAEWQLGFTDILKPVHYIAGTVAQGGPANTTPAAIARLGELTQPQYEKLNAFAAQIAADLRPLDGRALARAALYGGAARATYHETRIQEAIQQGYAVAERVIHASESCADCLDWEGFWPLDEVPPIGSSICMSNCLCSIEMLNEVPGGKEFNTSDTTPRSDIITVRQLDLRQFAE